jgi:predicted Zn-dependent peptidase
MKRHGIGALLLLAAAASYAAAPRPPAVSFPGAALVTLTNGVTIASQPVDDCALTAAQVSVPAGLLAQQAGNAGIAALTAAVVLHTPVDGRRSVTEVAETLGAYASYSVGAAQTRFYIESSAKDFPRLLHDLAQAMAHPGAEDFERERSAALAAQKAALKNPVSAAFDLIRQARYQGSGYSYPDAGLRSSVQRLQPHDVAAFAASYRHGIGTLIAIEGAVTPALVAAVKNEFSDLPRSSAPAAPKSGGPNRSHQVLAQRDVATTWAALGYAAPSEYSANFAAMLVLQSLLGGDGRSLSAAGNGAARSGFVGAYYQYEADPGVFVVFLNGAGGDIDKAMREMRGGIDRLKKRPLDAGLLERAKRLALGNYYMSVTSLADGSWLLSRAAASPQGVQFENEVPLRISNVSAADVRRVARAYLSAETTAIITPAAPE